MSLITWLNNREVPDVTVEIVQKFYNVYCTPDNVFIEKNFDTWDTKIHGPCNYLPSFYVAARIDKCGTMKYYLLAMY